MTAVDIQLLATIALLVGIVSLVFRRLGRPATAPMAAIGTGMGLKEAKDYVEDFAARMRHGA